MFKKLFGKNDKETILTAPVTGKVVDLTEVPDPTFSQKMMGEGLAIEPSEGKAVAPFDGEVVQLFPTKHAIGLKNKAGVEVLVHIGLETVGMNGEGFEASVKQGDKVKTGQTLVTFDLSKIEGQASSTVTPVIITNSNEYTLEFYNQGDVQAGSTEIMEIKPKAN
ncbi:PTS system glucose-specific EIIA component [Thalassobacillus devorans]|uniref:PTS system glucose-specific EIIA component n=1 Tax=Thalassobacillus devorans TaxID=279813 RepID=A0ABQ1PGS6_9BACI|nr:PTS glucose transporter subunit IIA [Thalassobacillus devorans]NIK29451.1 PTS system glucose-specific IIA component [Thalassobacillus devorans]GGC96793.1 PTS system glucose-specific EIIA component [Thalassobacillus devorans]